jgi:hypothetical protein
MKKIAKRKYNSIPTVLCWVTQGTTEHMATVNDQKVLSLYVIDKTLSSFPCSDKISIKWQSNGMKESVLFSSIRFDDDLNHSLDHEEEGRRSSKRLCRPTPDNDNDNDNDNDDDDDDDDDDITLNKYDQ